MGNGPVNVPESITFVTLDGVERQFHLTNRIFLEVARRAAKGNAGSFDLLWLALVDKAGLTEDQFVELLPMADAEIIGGLVEAINAEWSGRNKPDPRNEKFRPTKAAAI